MLDFLFQDQVFEIVAASIGLVSIYLQIKQNAWYWPVSLVMVIMYIFVYYQNKIYGDMSLQFYYVGVSLYGWYLWMFGKSVRSEKTSGISVTFTSKKLWIVLALVTIVLYLAMAWFLKSFTNSDIPFLDSFTTSLSFIATWMLAKKKIETWLIWIIVDFVSIGLYYHREMYPTMVLFFVLTILAFVGFSEWKKTVSVDEKA